MQRWEYRTALLHASAVSLVKTRGWRLKEINEQEQHVWKKAEVYSTLADFCNQMNQEGWELICAAYPNHTVSEVVLYFRHLL